MDTPNYKEKRREFVKEKVNSGVDRIEVLPFMNKPRTAAVYQEERYTAPKGTKKKAKSKLNKKRVLKSIGAVGLAGLLAFGGYKAYDEHKRQNSPITVEQAMDYGQSLEELGISEEIYNEIQAIDEKLENEDLTNIEEEINELQFSVMKTKVKNELPQKYAENIHISDITLKPEAYSSYGETKQEARIIVETDKDGEISFEVSDDIKDFINSAEKMRINASNVRNGDTKSEDNVKAYEGYMEEIKQMAAKELIIKGDSSIETATTKVKDIEGIISIVKEDNERELE